MTSWQAHLVLAKQSTSCKWLTRHPLVCQDFEALTPNLLARTIETVEGGGVVVMLLSSMTSLTQLYSLTMDVHARLRTDSHQDVTGCTRTPGLTPSQTADKLVANAQLQRSTLGTDRQPGTATIRAGALPKDGHLC